MLLNGMSLQGRPVFLYALAIPELGALQKGQVRAPSSFGFGEVAKRLDESVWGSGRHGIARPGQGMYSIQMTAAYMYENRMVVINIR